MITRQNSIIILLTLLLHVLTPAVYALSCDHVNEDQIKCDDGELFTIGDHLDQSGDTRFWIDIGVVAGLVLIAGPYINCLVRYTFP